MRADDLVPFLAPKPTSGVGFRQGVIVTWDTNTAENTVLVGGQLMTNLPVLNTSEAAILAADDVVGILTFGNTWAIMGRFTIPGTPEAASSLSSLRTQSQDVSASESTTSSTLTDLATYGPEVEINVGPSGRVLVILSAIMTFEVLRGSAINTSGAYMAYAMSGANTASAVELRALYGSIRYDSLQAGGFDTNVECIQGVSRVMLREGLNPGLTTFTAKYRRDTGGNVSFSNRNVTVMAI